MAKSGSTLKVLDETVFLVYCCCEGYGCTSVTEPHLCDTQGKMCCYKTTGTGDCIEPFGPDGCVLYSNKFCCIYSLIQFPPNPCFIELCGMTLMGPKKGERSGAAVVNAAGRNFGEGNLEEMKQSAYESIKSGDYAKAKEIVLHLEASKAASGVPNTMLMD
ncbi:hypothetical protein GUITHDRAFT_152632 [Guillardia theta CCMP2712]|uniref:Uncharacterized protein n=1 Tax=Guillardia theta (strain CCMP2712) TaxID=905079 RepID=L1JAI3_GUITC|nr:hypothetical protein GUITHDRAFT_152632 [Guillardia theta CCMP2712]EKX45558.1 hypothetical protein GUITHDRAFT_152632 [Guillardia theta CCMP2712]|eukprot:XP_005832538.1 hypothetical protein GUITHDRAFT_152632 [Guillardia theta CCMP2712]